MKPGYPEYYGHKKERCSKAEMMIYKHPKDEVGGVEKMKEEKKEKRF